MNKLALRLISTEEKKIYDCQNVHVVTNYISSLEILIKDLKFMMVKSYNSYFFCGMKGICLYINTAINVTVVF